MGFLDQPITLQTLFGPKRVIGPIQAQVVTTETTTDVLTITKQPVQQGATITDHAFKEPTVLSMTAYFKDNNIINGILSTFSGNGLSKLYQNLLDLQESRILFDVITPKRIYKNVLLAILTNVTDKKTENVLSVTMGFQTVILVPVSTVQVPRRNLKNPRSNGATQPAGKKSAVLNGKEAVLGLFGVKTP